MQVYFKLSLAVSMYLLSVGCVAMLTASSIQLKQLPDTPYRSKCTVALRGFPVTAWLLFTMTIDDTKRIMA